MIKRGLLVSLVLFLVLMNLSYAETVGYKSASWECYDGYKSSQSNSGSCYTYDEWWKTATSSCSGRCSGSRDVIDNNVKCGVNVLSVDGQCQRYPCTETDSGKDYSKKGTATGYLGISSPGYNPGELYGNFDDYCAAPTSTAIYEFYCDINQNGDKWVYQGFYYCPNGCKDGACIKGEFDLKVDSITPKETNEFDSSGKRLVYFQYIVKNIGNSVSEKFDVSNYVDGQPAGGTSNYQPLAAGQTLDIASTNTGYYLTSGKHTFKISISVTGDKDNTNNELTIGVYVNPKQAASCTDSDGGKNYYQKGEAVYISNEGIKSSVTDSCWDIGGQTLSEAYCENGMLNTDSFVQCDYGCSQGVCLSNPPVCYDSDQNNDLYLKGYATIDNGLTKIYDQCGYEQGYQSDSLILQSYCDNYKLKVSYSDYCPYGCKDGTCLKKTICPLIKCANPPQGCRYEPAYDENGCQTCGTLVCDKECETDSDCPVISCITTPCPQNKCISGKCVQTPTCKDSDGGKNYYKKGKTEASDDHSGGEPGTDGCLLITLSDDKSTSENVFECKGESCYVEEHFCSEGNPFNNIVICPSGCKDGQCNPSDIQIKGRCEDSDGRDYFTKAITWYTIEGSGGVVGASDVCCKSCFGGTTLSGPYVIENYCENDEINRDLGYECPNGCKDGACLSDTPTIQDSWEVKTETNSLELSENLNYNIPINREILSDIKDSIGQPEFKLLSSDSVVNSKGESNYKQTLYLLGPSAKGNKASGYVVYTENENDATADFLYFAGGKEIGKYELEFENPFQSGINGLELPDFENVPIVMFGKKYTIVRAQRISATESNGANILLVLLSGNIKDILPEKQTKVYIINDKYYEVSLISVNSDGAQFVINGQTTRNMKKGEFDRLADGTNVAVADLLLQDYSGGINTATFYLGAEKIELRDLNVLDPMSSHELKVNDEVIEDARVTIIGTEVTQIFKIKKIIVEMFADDDFYVPAGSALSNLIKNEGGQPQVLFTENWDIEYRGLAKADVFSEVIEVRPDIQSRGIYYLTNFDGKGHEKQIAFAKLVNGKVVFDYTSNFITTFFGAKISIINDTNKINFDIATPIDKVDNLIPTHITGFIDAQQNALQLTYTGNLNLISPPQLDEVLQSYTSYGAFATVQDQPSNQKSLRIEYPSKQRLPRVFITSKLKSPGPSCGNNICEAGEDDYCPPCTADPCPAGACHQGTCPQDCKKCIDSDKGFDQFTKGYTYYSDKSEYYEDSCLGESLNEYYCDSERINNGFSYCDYGCNEGKCNSEPPSSPVEVVDAKTDKRFYDVNEKVKITAVLKSNTSQFGNVYAVMHPPYCEFCESKTYPMTLVGCDESEDETGIPKIEEEVKCTYELDFEDTANEGFYNAEITSDLITFPYLYGKYVYFSVIDLKKAANYLILNDIDRSKIESIFHDQRNDYSSFESYSASYNDGGSYSYAFVWVFDTRDKVENFLREIVLNELGGIIKKEEIDGNVVYKVMYGEEEGVVFWTNENLFIGTEQEQNRIYSLHIEEIEKNIFVGDYYKGGDTYKLKADLNNNILSISDGSNIVELAIRQQDDYYTATWNRGDLDYEIRIIPQLNEINIRLTGPGSDSREVLLAYLKKHPSDLDKFNLNEFKLNFKKGWNLFSTPITDSGSTSFFSYDTDCSFLSPLWKFSNTEKKYEKAESVANSKDGYWVRVENDCIVGTLGDGFVDMDNFFDDFRLKAGWNIIGGALTPSRWVSPYFEDIKGTCKINRGPFLYNAENRRYEKAEFMESGKAYVLRVEGDCALGYPKETTYRTADWECTDGVKRSEVAEQICKTNEEWRQVALDYCIQNGHNDLSYVNVREECNAEEGPLTSAIGVKTLFSSAITGDVIWRR